MLDSLSGVNIAYDKIRKPLFFATSVRSAPVSNAPKSLRVLGGVRKGRRGGILRCGTHTVSYGQLPHSPCSYERVDELAPTVAAGTAAHGLSAAIQ